MSIEELEIKFQEIKEKMKKDKEKYIVHNCSMCNYPCGFIYINDILYYDSGCHCIKKRYIDKRNESEFMSYFIKEFSK